MKNFILIIVFICSNLFANAQNEFYNELQSNDRISSNFIGSVYNGKSILVYGDGGVILRSQDGGENWTRGSLDGKYKIVSIINLNDKYIAFCSNSDVYSSPDNGQNWIFEKNINADTLFQAIYQENKLYLLFSKSFKIFNSNLEVSQSYNITSNSGQNNFAISDDKVLISSEIGKLHKINLIDKKIESIDIIKLGVCNTCNPLLNLTATTNGNTVFSHKNDLFEYNIVSNKIEKISSLRTSTGNAFTYFNNALYHTYAYSFPWAVDSLFFNKINLTTKEITNIKFEGNDRYISNLKFSHLNMISVDTVISVGKNNLIYFSYDGGKNWELKSHLNTIHKIYPFNEKEYRAIGPLATFYASNDGACTWLPQKNATTELMEDSQFTDMMNQGTFTFKDKDNGFVFVNPEHTKSLHTAITNDGGNSINITTRYFLNYPTFTYHSINHKNNYLLYAYNSDENAKEKWSILWMLDDTLGQIHRSSLKDINMFFVCSYQNNLYAIAKDFTASNNLMFLYKSENDGKDWIKLNEFEIKEPISFIPSQANIIGDNIFVTWRTYENQISNQHCYKINLNSLESLNLFSIKANGIRDIVTLNNKYFASTYTYQNNMIKSNFYALNSINEENTALKEVDFNSRFTIPNIHSIIHDTLFTYIRYDSLFQVVALYTAKAQKITSVEISDTQEKAHLQYTAPYPIPAQNYVKSTIYWNSEYDINQAKFSVSDVFGTTIPYHNISIEQTDTYKGILQWDCTGISSGVYFMRVQLGSETITVPVAVGK